MENLSNQDMIIFRLNQIRNGERTELNGDWQLLNNRQEMRVSMYFSLQIQTNQTTRKSFSF